MKKLGKIIAGMGVAALVALALYVETSLTPEVDSGKEISAEDYKTTLIERQAAPEEEATPTKPAFRSYILAVMDACNSPLSPVLRNSRATVLANAIEEVLERDAAEHYVLALCIENKFQAAGVSTAGARGIAQIMPKYAQEFANLCQLGTLKEGDLDDVAVNATLGACLFRNLIKQMNSTILAVAAYNAGAASSSVKNLKALSAPVHETAGYVSKFAYLKEKMDGMDSN